MSENTPQPVDTPRPAPAGSPAAPAAPVNEQGTADKPRPHPDPTRYGDWEKNGQCIDF